MDTKIIEHNGKRYHISIERDEYMGPPWEEHDGHGIVSEWTTRDKAPGEIILCADRHAKRFYDFAASCKVARRDGWDAEPLNTGDETKRQQAAKAAYADFEHLRRWCNDDWFWCGVVVREECPRCGEPTGPSTSLWGIESDAGDFLIEVARQLIEDLQHECAAA